MKILLAIIIFSSIVPKEPIYKVYYNKGFSYLQESNYRFAIINFKKSYNLKPYVKTAYYIALSYNDEGLLDSCQKYCQIVLDSKPDISVNGDKWIYYQRQTNKMLLSFAASAPFVEKTTTTSLIRQYPRLYDRGAKHRYKNRPKSKDKNDSALHLDSSQF